MALDFPEVGRRRRLCERLGPAVGFYKIGLELVMAGGLDLARRLKDAGKQVFLDMKLLDIENTVERAARSRRRAPAPRSSPCTPRTARPCAPPSRARRGPACASWASRS